MHQMPVKPVYNLKKVNMYPPRIQNRLFCLTTAVTAINIKDITIVIPATMPLSDDSLIGAFG